MEADEEVLEPQGNGPAHPLQRQGSPVDCLRLYIASGVASQGGERAEMVDKMGGKGPK